MAKRKKRRPAKKPFSLPPPESKYPIATVAYYGPDDHTPTKIAVGIVDQHRQVRTLKCWLGLDVATNPEIQAEIQQFIEQNEAKHVVVTDGIIGCPHEDGIDFPEGKDCPYCPFWKGKQGTAARDI